jgi:hypothetical protein
MVRSHSVLGIALFVSFSVVTGAAGQVVHSSAGADGAAIQATVDAFRAALGDPNNGTTAGSQAGGRREISWDGGGDAANATTSAVPMTNFANRGNVYTTPGTGFEISGQPSPEFGDINATYPTIFSTFSSPRLFAPLGSNVVDVQFTVPGTTDMQAFSSGFGAVFTDVDLANQSTLEFFGPDGASLGVYAAPTMSDGLSFLGVSFGGAQVSRVLITTGNSALGPDDGVEFDVVALDDFIFGEPQSQPVPEPASLAILVALFGVGCWIRRRQE